MWSFLPTYLKGRGISQCFKTIDCQELLVLIFLAMALSGFVIHQMALQSVHRPLAPHSKTNLEPRIKRDDNMCTESDLKYFPNGTVDFRGFDNATGFKSGCFVVPDIVHLIKFNQDEFTFIELICIASILKNHKPGVLIIHTNVFRFVGRYWAGIKRLPDFHRVRVVYLSQPKSIHGISIEGKNANWHASDVARIQLIQKYGGIYMDGDVYVTQSLNHYRRFEFAVEWNYYMYLGSQVLIGHKDARILPHWLNTYKEYNASLWYYNGGELPTTAVLMKRPELFHRVRDHFGTSMAMLFDGLYQTVPRNNNFTWTDYPAIHLFIRLQSYNFNEKSTMDYIESPIKQMILAVMPDYMYPTLKEESEE